MRLLMRIRTSRCVKDATFNRRPHATPNTQFHRREIKGAESMMSKFGLNRRAVDTATCPLGNLLLSRGAFSPVASAFSIT
jgi:hypothetical protein